MSDALTVTALSKRFGDKQAVGGLDLTVRAGELFALLGPNGAGKTTTLRMVTGLLKPDAGEISVFGADLRADPAAAKRQVAWLPDEPMLTTSNPPSSTWPSGGRGGGRRRGADRGDDASRLTL